MANLLWNEPLLIVNLTSVTEINGYPNISRFKPVSFHIS